ncbi:hypothetical protein ABTF02_18535, partial [Acinetobacter baumannii]
MPRLIRTLLALLALLAGGRAIAHEATMGVVEFKEVQSGLYIGRWTSEPNIGAAKVQLRVPAHCRLALPELQCGAKGLVGP